MTTVTGKLLGYASPQRVEMKATLVDVTGKDAVGYAASVPGELVRPVPITPGADGAWTVDLTANTLITSQAGDTLWAIQEGRAKDGTPIVSYVAVPDSGTWWVGDILADLSSTQTGDGTVVYLPGAAGQDGASAYEVAVANGFTGSQAEWLASLVGPQGAPGSGGGAVDSVNGATGVVVLDAADVGADPAGAAAAAQTAAVSAAAADATAKVTAHTNATDPHGDRAAAATALTAHAGAADPHGDRSYTDTQTATRVPTTRQITAGTGLTGGGTLAADRTLAVAYGTSAGTAAAGNDPRLADARTPTAHAASHQAGGSDELALTQAQITGLAAALAGLFPKTGGTLTGDLTLDGHNLTVQRADGTGAYRFRVTGGGLDLEVGGMDVIVSTWTGADFTGTQADVLRLEAAGPHLIGRTQFGTNGYDDVHDIDPTTGVASLGAKNGSLNLRFCGRRTTTGAPTTGTWATGDVLQDSAGTWWLCTAAGTPGTWTSPPATPTVHAASHATGGSDPVSPASIGAEPVGTATAAVSAHTAASDPHGDRAYADGKLAKTANLSDLGSVSTARTNLGLGAAALLAVGTTAGTVAAGDDSRITGSAQKASNLSDLASASTARTNLGLGGAALLGVGTGAGTVAAGDDSRITGAAQKASNLADLASASTARSNLGLGGAALLGVGTAAGTVAAGDDSRITGALPAAGGSISGNLQVSGNALGQDFPAAHGVAAWCYDPALAVNSTQLTAGTLYLVRVNIAAAVNVTKMYWWVANTGSGATTNGNWVGLYSSAGTLLASTNVDAGFSSATLKATTIASTALAAGSFYWVGLLFNASVTPTLTRGSGWTGVDAAANLGLAASAYRFAKNGTGLTSLPSSITPSSNIGSDIAGPWVAVGA
ncbi:hypothetical protein [Streptomyces cylindrosporus]|uniref:Uncharacterized protein n=1 Tax=Streptomyces cylindrosporus TaxID=2927583 RepID=A0ABS9YPK2_9ACTN|nr:hypothetical protein [Streptomyces cylindrosporus]MCI3279203.1 hypothetical protein [Streptomyces cylindrosporus]